MLASHSRTVLSQLPLTKRVSIGTERDTYDLACMPREQGNLSVPRVSNLMGRRIVEPNTDATRHRKPSAVGRILYLIDRAFTEARFGTLGQVPLRGILGESVV